MLEQIKNMLAKLAAAGITMPTHVWMTLQTFWDLTDGLRVSNQEHLDREKIEYTPDMTLLGMVLQLDHDHMPDHIIRFGRLDGCERMVDHCLNVRVPDAIYINGRYAGRNLELSQCNHCRL